MADSPSTAVATHDRILNNDTMKLLRILLLAFCLTAPGIVATATTICKNPMIWADVPDPDVIRVGDTFYLVSTTMHLMPGGPIMESKDLTHWTTTGYIFDKLTDSPKYDMKGGTVYGRGQWATSLKYHDGKFYALFAPNDAPGGDTYIFSATRPDKGWTLVSRLPHFHDASLFFDDDGRVYVFHGTGHCTELTPDLKAVKAGGIDRTVLQRDSTETGLLEGSRLVKHDGRYYLLMVSWPAGKPRRQVCFRADNINEPWEKKIILEDHFAGFPYVGQGTIVDDQYGNWWGIIFQDRNGVGRVLTLNPCHWVDGWPMLGDENGRVPAEVRLPFKSEPTGDGVAASDDFSGSKLKLVWEWNHNPVDKAWSLTEHKGWLRLHTPNVATNIFAARNTISQRLMGPMSTVTVALRINKMRDGDRAGLAAFQGDAAMLEVRRIGKRTQLAMHLEKSQFDHKNMVITKVEPSDEASVDIPSKVIYLRMVADFKLHQDLATFFYSLDNKTWKPLGRPFKMLYDYTRLFMGTRAAIYNYATKDLGGYIDIDWYHLEVTK
jgi:beta-xylosidase